MTVAEADLLAVSEQLGRTVRDVVAIGARTGDGVPAVVCTAPRLADGTPFPTFYYLTHPVLVAAISRLEAEGLMREWNDLVAPGGLLTARYSAAHDAYLAARRSFGEVPEVEGISAGGMPARVKCLHALAAQALAAGPGVNPIGDLALGTAAAADPQVARLIGPWQPPAVDGGEQPAA